MSVEIRKIIGEQLNTDGEVIGPEHPHFAKKYLGQFFPDEAEVAGGEKLGCLNVFFDGTATIEWWGGRGFIISDKDVGDTEPTLIDGEGEHKILLTNQTAITRGKNGIQLTLVRPSALDEKVDHQP